MIKGDLLGFRDSTILFSLSFATCLEPLSLFFYTWRFLEILEREEEVKILSKLYRWFAFTSVLILPLGFYGTFVAYVIEMGNYADYVNQQDF